MIRCPHCGAALYVRPQGGCPHCGRPLPPESPAVSDELLEGLAAEPGRPSTQLGSQPAEREPDDDEERYEYEPSAAESAEMLAIRTFHRRLFQLTPRVPVTQAIVGLNILMFLVLAVVGREVMAFDSDLLVAWGANDGPQTLSGQWWRLATCMFLHGGLIHVAMNMWILWDLGRLVERLVGNMGFFVLYFVSGIAGSLASVYWRPGVLSVGASGAVFGVFGALMGFMLLRSDSVPKRILGQLRNSGLTFLVYSLIFGLSIPQIDMAAHVGGLVAGFACGLLMSQRLDLATWHSRAWRTTVTAILGGSGVALAMALAPAAPADIREELARFDKVQSQVIDAAKDLATQYQKHELSPEQYAAGIEQRVLPAWQQQRERFEHLGSVPPQHQERIARMLQYLIARQEFWELFVQELRDPDGGKWEQVEAKNREWQAIVEQLNER